MGFLALIPLALLAQTHTRWEASVQAEVRARTATPQDTNRGGNCGTADGGVVIGTCSGSVADLEVRPRLAGAIFNGPWTLAGSYSPTLRSREFYETQRLGQSYVEHSHILTAEAVWQKEAAARAFVAEYFNYGTLDLSTLSRDTTGGTGGVMIPPVRSGLGVVTDLTSDTSAGVDWYLTRRHTLTTTAGFLYGGGADEVSRASLPLQSSIRGLARLAYLLSRLDTISGQVGAQYVRFYQAPATNLAPANPGARIVIIEASANYARVISERTGANLSLGLTAATGQVPNRDPLSPDVFTSVNGVAPLVAGSIDHRIPFRSQRFDLRANASYAPFVDRFAGSVYQRVEAGAAASWTHVNHVSAGVSAGIARSIPVTNEPVLTTLSGDARIGYAGDPWWRVDLTGRLSLNDQPPVTPAIPDPMAAPYYAFPDKQWLIGLSITFFASSTQPRTFQGE